MVRKRKANINKKSAQKTPSELEQDAKVFFVAELFKEAINSYKSLLKIEQRSDWQAQLAQAYLGRCQQLADKALFLEATVLWDNYEKLNQGQELVESYLYWLGCAGQYSKIAIFLKTHANLDSTLISNTNVRLAAALLSGEEKILSVLANDHPVIVYYSAAKNALQAYSQNNIPELEQALKQISFRSPYKDLKSLFKALLNLSSDTTLAKQLLQKIPLDSPYYQLAQICQIHNLSEPQQLKDFARLEKPQREFVQKLAGLDKTQIKLLNNCQRVLINYTDKQAFELVLKNKAVFGELKSQQFALGLLPYYSKGKKLIQRSSSLSKFETKRIQALTYEQKHEDDEAIDCWIECAKILNFEENPDNALKLALILRHIVALIGNDYYDADEITPFLEDSLKFDPDDKSTYLKLIAVYKRENNSKQVMHWLDKASNQYPQDIDFLMVNIKENMQKKAYKKAAGFAKELLKKDPINIQAKNALIDCHLAHSRKLFKLVKYDLAEKEALLAEGISMGKYKNGLIISLKALIAFKKADTKGCKLLLEQGQQAEKGALCGLYRIHIEILSLSLPSATVMRLYTKPEKSYTASVQEIMALNSMIESYHQDGNEFVSKVFSKVKAIFKKSLNYNQSTFLQDEFISLCHCFEKLNNFEMLRFISNMAIAQYTEIAIFDYYVIYSKINGNAKKLSHIDILRLQNAQRMAKNQNDKRTMEKLNRLITDFERSRYVPFFDDNYKDSEEDYDSDFVPPRLFGDNEVDEENDDSTVDMNALMSILQKTEEMDEFELMDFLFDGKMPSPQQTLKLERLGEKGFQAMLIEKILEQAGMRKHDLKGIDIADLLFRNGTQ